MQIKVLADPDAVERRATTLAIGLDGHSASLVHGDPVLEITDMAVALTDHCQGRRRMTLTYSMLDRARHILWLVIRQDKAAIVRLQTGDCEISAGRVRQNNALLLADWGAAGSRWGA
jgi:6-phosphogluconolactonase